MWPDALEHLAAPSPRAEDAAPLECAPLRGAGERVEEGLLIAPDGRWWWIADAVPRLLPPDLYRNPALEERYGAELRARGLAPHAPHTQKQSNGRLSRIESKTIDRFGEEWRRFRDWGFLDEAPAGKEDEHRGGLWAHTLAAFSSKTFLPGKLDDKLVLDAGAGNGRFTAAALHHGAREMVSVDIGWGVDAMRRRFERDRRVHVVQASLFELPVRRVEAAFSLGVLMHTGDAERAFKRIAVCVEPGGLFAVRMYHKGNRAYETVDATIRRCTTRLSKPAQLRVARGLAAFGRTVERAAGAVGKPELRFKLYQVLRNWPTVHHNLEWWSAPVASHHTAPEVVSWGSESGLRVATAEPAPEASRPGFFAWPEALTILFERPPRQARASLQRARSEPAALEVA